MWYSMKVYSFQNRNSQFRILECCFCKPVRQLNTNHGLCDSVSTCRKRSVLKTFRRKTNDFMQKSCANVDFIEYSDKESFAKMTFLVESGEKKESLGSS